MSELTFYLINEETPADRWRELFDALWPGYRSWYLQEGDAARPSLLEARSALERYMPELVPTWASMVALTDGDPTAARMLTLFNPPAFAPGCSQVAIPSPEPMLVRNYDYHPGLCERIVYSSRFSSRRVVGSGDCLWGLLDGMNDDGLAASLTFAGQRGVGQGFGIPLVVRYVLETAGSVAEAIQVLGRVPVHMSYNIMLVDRSDAVTVLVRPGVPPETFNLRASTNHRGTVPLDPEHAARYQSVERQHALFRLLATAPDRAAAVAAFLRPPLYNTEFGRGFGTMYTAAYRPDARVVDFVWPGSSWRIGFDTPTGTRQAIYLPLPAASPAAAP